MSGKSSNKKAPAVKQTDIEKAIDYINSDKSINEAVKKPRKVRENKPRENYDVFTFDMSPTQREFVISHNKVVIRYFIYDKQHEVNLDFSNKEGMVRSVQKQIKSRNSAYTHIYRFTVVAPIDTANSLANSTTQEQLITTILRDVFIRAEAQKVSEQFQPEPNIVQEFSTNVS